MSYERKKHGGIRMCARCLRTKPDRTHHCSQCNRCVLKMDHHCPWIHNCVGLFNYVYFCCFLFFTVLSSLFMVRTYVRKYPSMHARRTARTHARWHVRTPAHTCVRKFTYVRCTTAVLSVCSLQYTYIPSPLYLFTRLGQC